ncbi:MAG TPA: formylmethanofuran dehydrogenase subunit C [Burkholderiales bacterium]|jgi:formylmethanofuran dehydrogenase subunit C|nr:formylmethanofuran dehydrogenase subunit C [Burkholderiales bacterium]
MSALTLTLRALPPHSVDLSPLIPDRLAGLSRAAIENIAVGSRGLQLSDLFAVSGDDAQQMIICNSSERLTHIGSGMTQGTITVEGDCGAYGGLGMRGGRIVVTGNAGAFAGSGMSAGGLEIRGNAGDFLGGALPGDKQGMRGGIIVVHGNAGDRAADRMRRGLILVGGNAGAYCGSRMLAGTVLVSGHVGVMPGFALRRGTLLLAQRPPELPVTFQDSGEHALLFLTLLERELRRESERFARFLPLGNRVRRYCGDLANSGTGEILVLD